MSGVTESTRRVAAVVLPELMNELARVKLGIASAIGAHPKNKAFAVVLTELGAEPVKATALLDAVSSEARRFGVREGQSIAEACALVAHLAIVELDNKEIETTLARVAELALGFGATVAFEAPDTVWVDVTGATHLYGSETALAAELASRVRALGHLARVALCSGPRIAQALGRFGALGSASVEPFGERGVVVVPPGREREALKELPVRALPIVPDARAWLVRLGVLTLGELARIPRASAATRLGEHAAAALDLAEGKDDEPLVAYQPPAVLVEQSSWDDPAPGIEPLLFVLRGLAGRMSARLAGRGEAAQKLVLTVTYDASIARHHGVGPQKELIFDLSTPLWREEEIRRVVSSRLERTRLEAPSVGLCLQAPAIIRAMQRQLDLSRVSGGVTGEKGLETLPVLLAELGADIGKDRVGVLALVDSHRPEQRSELRPALAEPGGRRPKKARKRESVPLRSVRKVASSGAPSRLLGKPVPIESALRVGVTLRIDHRLYQIERIGFIERLESLEWWSGAPVSRDYLRLWLRGTEGVLEAWVYVDRESGRRFLHAVGD